MCLCWNPDGSMCGPDDIPRRIKLAMEGKWKIGVGEVPAGQGSERLKFKPKPKTEYDKKACAVAWKFHNSKRDER